MAKTYSVPIPIELWNAFSKFGFTTQNVLTYLDILIPLWRANDNLYSVTANFIRDGVMMEPLQAQLLIAETIYYWYPIAQQIRNEAVNGRLIRWVVMTHVILLELEECQPIPKSGLPTLSEFLR